MPLKRDRIVQKPASIHSSPVLCLRGGGADAKRKETRKRKFAALTSNDLEKAKMEMVGNNAVFNHNESEAHEAGAPVSPSGHGKDGSEAQIGVRKQQSQRSPRFICFVGNLPFTASTDNIRTHFEKVQPSSVRHMTSKDLKQSKGFAFLEFEGYDRMKTCLKLYHHSSFDDGVSPARNINVELTAGGGGNKSSHRKSKLVTKNEKLQEERKRRAQEEERQRRASGSTQTQKLDAPDDTAVHPSRRSHMSRS